MRKVTITPSVTSLNSIDVSVQKESHTLAAPLVERILNDTHCVFAAYKIEHPYDDFVSIRIQGDERKNARTILEDGLKSIIKDLNDLITQVKNTEE